MIKYVFDVDGVLTNRAEAIHPKFKKWFLEWSLNKNYYLLTGSERSKTIEQIGTDLVENAKIGFHCLGNSVWINNRETKLNQFKLKQDELNYLNEQIHISPFKFKTGDHIELRSGSINFSIVGRNANLEERTEYIKYDLENQERRKIIIDFVNKFQRFDAYIGGDISIDICLRGANKGQIYPLLKRCNEDIIYFFGDRCFNGGIDYPLAKQCNQDIITSTSYQIDNGYEQTQQILEKL